ncbi:MAG: AAA family ATPase [Spirochaetaceae bacterium]|nr:AAA family ATPase [Spirochaetaceae bacterium]
MPSFLARISLNYSFAQEKLTDQAEFWNDVRDAITEPYGTKLLSWRFTFATFSLYTDTKEECKKILRNAWEKVFPKTDAISSILVTEDNGDNISKAFRTLYSSYYGVTEYQQLATELRAAVPELVSHGATSVLRNQNYLFAIDSGCGFTALISSLGDLLHELNIYDKSEFKTRKYYYEFKIGAEDEDEYSTSASVINKLYESKEKNPYTIIGIDISYYLQDGKTDELRRFIRRLEDYQDNFVFAFRIPFLEKDALKKVVDTVSDMALVRTVQVPPLHECVMIETFWNVLLNNGYSPDSSLVDVLIERVHQEKKDGRYYGFKTATKIAHEVILKKSLDTARKRDNDEDFSSTTIDKEDLAEYAVSGKQEASGYEELSKLIGMESITERIKEIIAQVKIAAKNEKLDHPCIHMRFVGSPGTGKTTVARIIGQILKQEGILRKGGFFEYKARDLVAEYVGQTTVKTSTICRDAYGSVLFLDEAYSLYEGTSFENDFGKEAITALVSEMENHREDMLVIMAGYTDEMEYLMKANPGLRSRMPYVLTFPNYTKEQLFDIFMQMVKKHFEYTKDLETVAKDFFMNLSDEYLASKEFANARFVRNLYERTWSKAALRVSLAGETTIVLQKEDFIAASEEKEFNEKIMVEHRIGF